MPSNRALEALIYAATRKATNAHHAKAIDQLELLYEKFVHAHSDDHDEHDHDHEDFVVDEDVNDHDHDANAQADDAGSIDEATYEVPTKIAAVLANYEDHWNYFGLYEDFMGIIDQDPASPGGNYPGWLRKWDEPGDKLPRSVKKLFKEYDATYDDGAAGESTTDDTDTTSGGGDTTNDGSDTTSGDSDTTNDGSDTTSGDSDTTNDGSDTTSGSGDTTNDGSDTTSGGGGSTGSFGWVNEHTYISGGDTPDGFNVELVFDTSFTQEMKDAVAEAAETLSDLITGDISDHDDIDDVRIIAYTGNLSTYATGGVNAVRDDSPLTSEGRITFDNEKSATLLKYNVMDDMALHEMIHALGFGSGLSRYGLKESIGGETRFTGENAIDVYNTQFASKADDDPFSDQGVPMDGAHWSESDFRNEIMTPTLSTNNYVSDLTLAALEDMGYETTYEAEDELLGMV